MMRIGIRREDKNEWERRVPLTPSHVHQLVDSGIGISVQPSSLRVFADEEYRASGATVQDDLSDCALVLAVKEVPATFFRERGSYMFFSHVCKGQSYNMGMLRKILDLKATLIDYERVTDDQNKRLIFFGRQAGSAGIIETLYALGRRLEWEGTPTPLTRLCRPLEMTGLEEGKALLADIGGEISRDGLPESLVPLVVGFTGYGNVSQGAQELFDLLPHEEIAADELASFVRAGKFSDRKFYKVVFREQDMVVPRDSGSSFHLGDYYENPERYSGVFEQYLPYLTTLVNCIYWDERYPKLVTKEWLRRTWAGSERPTLRVIGDITCDVGGSIECTVEATEPGNPNYTYLPADGSSVEGWEGDGPVVMAVDTLPSEVPLESSSEFGDMLIPYMPSIAAAQFGVPFAELVLPAPIKRAVVVYNGEFTPDYQYLSKFV
jgi:saccharopine dehydrogenase (NAD+, L-lysine-forming)